MRETHSNKKDTVVYTLISECHGEVEAEAGVEGVMLTML